MGNPGPHIRTYLGAGIDKRRSGGTIGGTRLHVAIERALRQGSGRRVVDLGHQDRSYVGDEKAEEYIDRIKEPLDWYLPMVPPGSREGSIPTEDVLTDAEIEELAHHGVSIDLEAFDRPGGKIGMRVGVTSSKRMSDEEISDLFVELQYVAHFGRRRPE